jgi:hypothetical protein
MTHADVCRRASCPCFFVSEPPFNNVRGLNLCRYQRTACNVQFDDPGGEATVVEAWRAVHVDNDFFEPPKSCKYLAEHAVVDRRKRGELSGP